MPLGNLTGSATTLPLASRSFDSQASSSTTYLYPASLMPLATSASAVSLTKDSLIFPANVFQVFQPIGGVGANPSNFWANADTAKHSQKHIFFIEVGWS